MQGKNVCTQDGARIWKTQPYIKLIWEMVTPCSLYLTGMEVINR